MGDTHVPLRRVLLPWVTGATLLVLTAFAVWRVAASRDDMVERERARLQSNVENAVEDWEEALIDDLTRELENVAALDLDRVAERERMLRRREFAAIYLWTAPTNTKGDPPRMLFPVTNAGTVDEIIRASPCLLDAAQTAELYPDDIGRSLRTWLFGCSNEDPNVQLLATSRAAIALQYAGRYDAAREAIERADLSMSASERVPGANGLLTLQGAARRGISPFRLAVVRMQRADLLFDVGRVDDALVQLQSLGDQIAMLDAPDYATTKPVFARVIIDELAEHGPPDQADALQRKFEAADRRIRAYREITDRILPTASAARVGEAPRFIYDQYSDHPFVLFYGWAAGPPALGVALQLEQTELLGTFVRKLGQFRDHVTITDANGQLVYGRHRDGEDAVVVQFTRTLPQLRVHVGRAALEPYLDDDPWAGVALIAFCLVLGLIALAGQVQANRQLAELLDRQRAFTTRVTHELKTPLAGIRVMAENLENGVFRGESQRSEMAARIVGEVDRLTSRVDEVLAVARERTIPSPRPFDPEEVLLGLVEEWGPRFATDGVDLHADLATTDPINGDGAAFRDAVGCLLDNALKYRREDGRVRPQVWLDLVQDGRRVTISVSDNGIGVPRLMRKAIFGRFVRVEGSNRGKAGGHGLGLHQVREIVRAHKGTVTCTEGVDGGARFEIVLNALTPR